jgi:hypothetical protein
MQSPDSGSFSRTTRVCCLSWPIPACPPRRVLRCPTLSRRDQSRVYSPPRNYGKCVCRFVCGLCTRGVVDDRSRRRERCERFARNRCSSSSCSLLAHSGPDPANTGNSSTNTSSDSSPTVIAILQGISNGMCGMLQDVWGNWSPCWSR